MRGWYFDWAGRLTCEIIVRRLWPDEKSLLGAGPWCDLSSSPSNLRYALPSCTMWSCTTVPQPLPSTPLQIVSPRA